LCSGPSQNTSSNTGSTVTQISICREIRAAVRCCAASTVWGYSVARHGLIAKDRASRTFVSGLRSNFPGVRCRTRTQKPRREFLASGAMRRACGVRARSAMPGAGRRRKEAAAARARAGRRHALHRRQHRAPSMAAREGAASAFLPRLTRSAAVPWLAYSSASSAASAASSAASSALSWASAAGSATASPSGAAVRRAGCVRVWTSFNCRIETCV